MENQCPFTRRTLLETSAVALAGLAGPAQGRTTRASTRRRSSSRPVVLSSKNGLRGVAKANELLTNPTRRPARRHSSPASTSRNST
jgi:hypothetical protein